VAEAARLTGADRCDVLSEDADGEALLAPERTATARARLDTARGAADPRSAPRPGAPPVITAVDRDRQGITLIQSNASDFGAHLVEPNTGTFLHNRGIGFRVTPGHPGAYGPGRRPPHTLSPALVTDPRGALRAVLGTMGGDVQPQVVLGLLLRLLAHGEAPGPAVSAPRVVLDNATGEHGFDLWDGPDRLIVEDHAPSAWVDGLRDRGHEVLVRNGFGAGFGHAQVIEVTADGVAGAADPRAVIGAATGH
jgi:gamma-glutamyltranspeptidase/glutathione hydrolase